MLNFDNSFFVKISKKPLQKRQLSEFPIIENNNLLINKQRKSSNKSNSFHNKEIKLPQIRTNNLKYFNKENRLKTEKKNQLGNFESLPKRSAVLIPALPHNIINNRIKNFSHGLLQERKKKLKNYLEAKRLNLLQSLQNNELNSTKIIDFTDILDMIDSEQQTHLSVYRL